MKTLILICVLGLSRPDCSTETATVVLHGPEAANLAQCGFLGQAYLADTALAGYVDDGHYLKILCTSGNRLESATLTTEKSSDQADAASMSDRHPTDRTVDRK